jgi:hypothetical protein
VQTFVERAFTKNPSYGWLTGESREKGKGERGKGKGGSLKKLKKFFPSPLSEPFYERLIP